MPRINTVTRYSVFAQYLHWLVVALLVGQWAVAELAEGFDDVKITKLALMALHKSFGMTVLMVAVLRLAFSRVSRQPAYPSYMSEGQRRIAGIAHHLLYVAIFALPITGWLGSSAASYSVSWFNLFEWPDLVPVSESLKEAFFIAHEWSWRLLCVLVVLHVAAVVKHQWFHRFPMIRTMFSPWVFALAFVALLVVLAFAYKPWSAGQRVLKQQLEPSQDISSLQHKANQLNSDTGDIENALGTQAELIPINTNAWTINYSQSAIKFTTEQAGAEFEGQFTAWQSTIVFDARDVSSASIDTVIDLGSVSTQDQERDTTLVTPEFFHVSVFPQARFSARDVRWDDQQARYTATSTLAIKGQVYPVDFWFSVEAVEGQKQLRGMATLDRLQLAIGEGEWLDTEWIGQYVQVSVYVVGI